MSHSITLNKTYWQIRNVTSIYIYLQAEKTTFIDPVSNLFLTVPLFKSLRREPASFLVLFTESQNVNLGTWFPNWLLQSANYITVHTYNPRSQSLLGERK